MKISSLNQNHDFKRMYHRGKYSVNYALVTYLLPNKNGGVRIGITASKKIGNAVTRNRARRVIREAYGMTGGLTGNYDIVFVARGGTAAQKSHRLAKIMDRQLKECILQLRGKSKDKGLS